MSSNKMTKGLQQDRVRISALPLTLQVRGFSVWFKRLKEVSANDMETKTYFRYRKFKQGRN